jgi:hypothetical protein
VNVKKSENFASAPRPALYASARGVRPRAAPEQLVMQIYSNYAAELTPLKKGGETHARKEKSSCQEKSCREEKSQEVTN